MFRTRWIRKLFNRPCNLRKHRRQTAQTRNPVRLRLEALEERVTPCDSTSLVPGNVALQFFGSAQSPQFTIPVTVNDTTTGGTASSGTVTINLVSGNTTITLGSATVGSNGVADVDVDLGQLPSNLSVGSFQLQETFSGDSDFFASSGSGSLSITTVSTTVVTTSVAFNFSQPTTVTQSGGPTIPIGADADNFVVLYEGQGGHTLHISNSSINGNVGVGGTGAVNIDGHAAINGDLDFAGDADGKFDDAGGDDDSGDKDHGHGNKDDDSDKKNDDDEDQETTAPNAINANDAVVTAALNAVNALSASLAGLGTNIDIDGSETINESAGQLVTVNGVSCRVFNVTDFKMGDHDKLTIKGDGSGMPVVFNFAGHGDVNLGGDVDLDNGLSADQVLWNVTGSGGNVHVHGDDDSTPDDAFQGIILAPNDTIDLDHANIIGRVFGGDDKDMQIVGQVNIDEPPSVPTITTTTSGSFTVTVDVTSSAGPATSGTVTFQVVAGNETINLGTASVGPNGVATLTVTDQTTLQELASLMPGGYTLDVTYNGSGPFAPGTTTTTVTINPEQTTVTAPPTVNVTINNNTTYNITINVNSPNGPVSSGTVTIDLVNGNQTIPLGTGTVGPNGTVTITLNGTPISNLPPGQYQLVVNFESAPGTPNGNGTTTTSMNLLPQTSPGAVTTTPPTSFGPGAAPGDTPGNAPAPLSPMQAALELALDLGMLGNMSNPGSVGELQMFSTVFLGHTLPTLIPQLISDIQSLLPQLGSALSPALSFASFLDEDLPIENPM